MSEKISLNGSDADSITAWHGFTGALKEQGWSNGDDLGYYAHRGSGQVKLTVSEAVPRISDEENQEQVTEFSGTELILAGLFPEDHQPQPEPYIEIWGRRHESYVRALVNNIVEIELIPSEE